MRTYLSSGEKQSARIEEAKAFAVENLAACTKEIISWTESGVLAEGKLRELAEKCALFCSNSDDSLKIAKQIVEWEALVYTSEVKSD